MGANKITFMMNLILQIGQTRCVATNSVNIVWISLSRNTAISPFNTTTQDACMHQIARSGNICDLRLSHFVIL